jgi:hypothetical protein
MISPGWLFSGRGLFVALGLADLLMTCYLLGATPQLFFESNPFARWWLDRWGWAGLAGFKMATILFTLTAITILARRRPRVAGSVLCFACGATALVVIYSGTLAFATRGLSQMKALAERGCQIDAQLRPLQEYCYLRARLREDLQAGRCSFTDAVARLAATEQARDPTWLAALRRQYPGQSDAECLAASLRESLDRPAPDPVFSSWAAPSPPGTPRSPRHPLPPILPLGEGKGSPGPQADRAAPDVLQAPAAAHREPQLVGPLPTPLPG